MRIGLLEVVQRAQGGVLLELPQFAVAFEEVTDAGLVVADRFDKQVSEGVADVRVGCHIVAQGLEEAQFQGPAQGQ